MTTLILLATVAIPIFALLLALPVALARPALGHRLAAYRGSAPVGARDPREAHESFARRVVLPLLHSLTFSVARFMPGRARSRLQTRLDLAGRPAGFTPGTLWTMSLVLGLLFVLAPMVAVAAGALRLTPLLLGGALAGALLGSRLPGIWLSRRVAQRQQLIQRELPDALDLIVVSVEAGLGLDAALARVSARRRGPLAEELGHTLEDIRLGRARRDALLDTARRVDVAEFRQFVAAVVQTLEVGGDVGEVLRIQAESARTRRRLRAQERAMRAPVKMVFPLVLLVFPSLFIVLLAPAALRAIELFK